MNIYPEPNESFEHFVIRAHRLLEPQITDPMERNELIWHTWEQFVGPQPEEAIATKHFPADKYTRKRNVCLFAEHSAVDGQGRPRTYGLAEMIRVARGCNDRIADFDGFAPLADGHTPGPEDADQKMPEILGYVGPYRLGMIGRKKPRWAVFADEWHPQNPELQQRLAGRPRRSVELWTFANDPSRMYFDPIAALGAETPRLSLPVQYRAAERDGAQVERYSFESPGGANTFVRGAGNMKDDYCNDGKPKQYEADEYSMGPTPQQQMQRTAQNEISRDKARGTLTSKDSSALQKVGAAATLMTPRLPYEQEQAPGAGSVEYDAEFEKKHPRSKGGLFSTTRDIAKGAGSQMADAAKALAKGKAEDAAISAGSAGFNVASLPAAAAIDVGRAGLKAADAATHKSLDYLQSLSEKKDPGTLAKIASAYTGAALAAAAASSMSTPVLAGAALGGFLYQAARKKSQGPDEGRTKGQKLLDTAAAGALTAAGGTLLNRGINAAGKKALTPKSPQTASQSPAGAAARRAKDVGDFHANQESFVKELEWLAEQERRREERGMYALDSDPNAFKHQHAFNPRTDLTPPGIQWSGRAAGS